MFTTHLAVLPVRKALATGLLVAGACAAFAGTAQAAPLIPPGVGSMDLPAGLGVSSPADQAPPTADSTPEQRAVTYVESKVGAPYVWGATGPDTFDCSGLMQWAYEQVGVSIPRTSQAQETAGEPVDLDALRPGDLVFFYNGEHVGMYVGDGNVIHAPDAGDHVKSTPVSAMGADTARRY